MQLSCEHRVSRLVLVVLAIGGGMKMNSVASKFDNHKRRSGGGGLEEDVL